MHKVVRGEHFLNHSQASTIIELTETRSGLHVREKGNIMYKPY